MIPGAVIAPLGRRRQERLGRRDALCLQTKHVAGSCQGCARSLGDLAHVVEGGEAGIQILCGECCPCSAAERQQTGPDSGRRMNA